MNKQIIDITYPVSQRLPKWPGSIGLQLTSHLRMPEDMNNLSSINVDCHFGTHLDAPSHFIFNGKTIDQLDLNKCIGEVYIAEIYNAPNISYQHLEQAAIPKSCKKLLLKTDNQKYWKQGLTTFQEDFSSIDKTGVKWILEHNIELIGIDYLSIQRFHDGPEIHQQLLKAEIVIVESLNLENVNAGLYELICLPIYLVGLEGAPVRAILKYLDYENQ